MNDMDNTYGYVTSNMVPFIWISISFSNTNGIKDIKNIHHAIHWDLSLKVLIKYLATQTNVTKLELRMDPYSIAYGIHSETIFTFIGQAKTSKKSINYFDSLIKQRVVNEHIEQRQGQRRSNNFKASLLRQDQVYLEQNISLKKLMIFRIF
eukprot:267218_1